MLISKIRNAFKRDLFKVFSLNAGATLVRMLTGFISVKIVAVIIGPSGVALLGQLNNFTSTFLTCSTGGINGGVTRYVAEYSGSQQKVNVYLRTAFTITLILSLFCGAILTFGSRYFSNLILGNPGYQSIIVVFGLLILLYALNSLLISVLNGYKQFRIYVRVNIVGNILGLLVSIALAYFAGVYGALLAAVTYQSVVFLATVFLCAHCHWFKIKYFLGKFDGGAGKQLAQYSLMALISAATVPVGQLVIRGYIAEHVALVDAGIWEGMNRISGIYLMVITTSLAVYYLPRLSELHGPEAISKEIRSVYKLIIPILLLGSFVIYVSRRLIVHVLFSKDFSSMEHLFAFQLTGDFLKIVSWVLAYQMVAKSMTKLFVVTEIGFNFLLVVLSILFIREYGNVGATIAYAVNYLLYLIFMVGYFKKLLFK
jgi:O-antigen/teichoic acid export membrane protein